MQISSILSSHRPKLPSLCCRLSLLLPGYLSRFFRLTPLLPQYKIYA